VDGKAGVYNEYPRIVREEGNPAAQALLGEAFEPCETRWRGLGSLPGSGYRLREEFSAYDATELVAPFLPEIESEPAGCRCGEVLKGLIEPAECGLFATGCTPDSPIGPCMVSSEGACAAHYNYRGVEESLR
jgi:hydrogenase expression/formation protein HypD